MLKKDKLAGLIACGAILCVVLGSIFSLFLKAEFFSFLDVFSDSYIWHTLYFSLYQAAFSTILSIVFAVFIALALYRRDFWLKSLILRIFSITFVLPSLIGVFGIIAIYGNSGFINSFFSENILNIYGLSGILLTHIFFNIPLATKMFYQSLSLIETNQHKLAMQLNLSTFRKFLYLEFPVIKQIIPQVASLVFMLCFTSFAIVMALGGGPQSTTLEVAIYQAIKYDFDLSLAAFLSILQILICTILALLVEKFSKPIKNRSFYDENLILFKDSKVLKIFDISFIGFSLILILPPLLAIIRLGINEKSLEALTNPQLFKALINSTQIAISSAIISIFLAICIIVASRAYRMENSFNKANLLELLGTIILLTPSIVVSTGLFILFNPFINVFDFAFYFVVIVNSLMALPFIIRSLSHNFFTIQQEYKQLCDSLGIKGINRFFIVEFRAFKKPLANAISLSFILSMGDLSAISLFGNWDFKTLPLLLFEQMGSYRMDEAALSALILLIFSLVSFSIIEIFFQKKGLHAKH